MPYYFQKCCFDSEKLGVRNECDRLSCVNRKHDFGLFFHRTNDESFYCLNRRQLKECWHCVIAEQEAFFPGRHGKCHICNEFNEILENLRDAYFFLPSKYDQQPVLWKVFFEAGNKLRQFRIEIAETVESKNIVLNHGSIC